MKIHVVSVGRIFYSSLIKYLLMMKFVAVLLLISVFQVNAESFAQTITLSKGDISIASVFKEIKRQTDYNIVCDRSIIYESPLMNIKADRVPLLDFLDELTKSNRLSYVIEKQTIVVKRLSESDLSRSSAQQKVSGRVVDEQGTPLEGVTVTVKNASIYATTDPSGNYHINVPPEYSTLSFTIVGFSAEERDLTAAVNATVVMKRLVSDLDEVVVVGYGSVKKQSLTGAVASVNGKQLTVAPVSNVTNSLAGRLPGLISKQTSGAPGQDAASLSIRGFGNALIIIDGVEGDLNLIAPNEIESISILKDASAAIYGARAGNGVVLVTTKRGSIGVPRITFNSSYSIQTNTRFMQPVNSWQFAEMEIEKWMHQGGVSTGTAAPFTEEDVERYKKGDDPRYPNTDWFSATLRNGTPMKENSLSLTGGNDNVKYYGYIGYLDQQAFFKSNDGRYQRVNVRSNVDVKVTEKLSASIDLSAISNVRKFPWRAASGDAEFFFDLWESKPIYPAFLPDPSKYAYSGTSVNVMATSRRDGQGYRDNLSQRYTGSLLLEYKFDEGYLEGLSAKAFINYITNSSQEKSYQRPYFTYTYNADAQTYETKGGNEASELNEVYTRGSLSNGQFSLAYTKDVRNHRINLLLLSEFNEYYNSNVSAGRSNFEIPEIDYLFGGSEIGMRNSGSASEMGRFSYIGRLNYGYKDKYLLDATIRRDASARFSEESRWGTFPSVSVAWRASEESFIKRHISFFDDLKLRASISQTGNDEVGSFPYISGYAFVTDYPIGNRQQKAIGETAMANPDLTWEKMTLRNIGLDFTVLAGKLYGEFDVFNRERKGIPGIRSGSISYTFGASLPVENINSQHTSGFEAKIGSNFRRGDYSIHLSVNTSYARTKWSHFDEPDYTDPDDILINKKTGEYVDRSMGFLSDGLFTSMAEIYGLDYNQDGVGNLLLRPGDIKLLDLNGDGLINWRDQAPIASGTMPHWMGGLNIDLTYKRFDLSALFQGAFDFVVYNQMYIGTVASTLAYEGRWSETHNNSYAIAPRYGSSAPTNNNYSDYWVKDASYVRLKALSVGYSLFVKKAGIDALRLYAAGTNLLTFDKLTQYGVDPEVTTANSRSNGTGGTRRNGTYYPQQRTFTFGITLTL